MTKEIEARLKISAVDRTGVVLKGVAGKLDQVNRRAEQHNRQIEAAALRQQRLAAVTRIGMVAGAAAAAGVVYSTKVAANFEEALFNIEKKSGATKDQMARLREEVLSLSKEIPVSIDEIASAFERGAAAGIPVDELREFSKLTAGVADAWDTTSEHVGNVFAGFTAGLNMSRKDLQSFASLINDLADSGIADETDIADFIDRAGASLKNFGMTPEEIAAYGAALLNLKMPAEVGARAMDTITGKLLAPENLSTKSFSALKGIVGDMEAFTKLTGNAKLQFFLKQVERLSSQQRASLLGALLGEGFDDEIMRLVAGVQELERNLALASEHVIDPSSSITDAQIKKMALFNAQLELMKNRLERIAIGSGEIALPWLTNLNQGLDLYEARQRGMEQRGWSWARRQLGVMTGTEPLDLAYEGGYRDKEFVAEYWESRYGAGKDDPRRPKSSTVDAEGNPTGRTSRPITRREFPGGGRSLDAYNLPEAGAPTPTGRPEIPLPTTDVGRRLKDLQQQYQSYGEGRQLAADKSAAVANMDVFRGIRENINQGLSEGGDEAGRRIVDSGKEGGDYFASAVSSAIRDAAASAAATIRSVLQEATRQGTVNRNLANAGNAIGGMVNADTGRSMPPEAGRPAGSRRRGEW